MDARNRNAWTPEELDTLRKLYPTNGAAGVGCVLTHRTEAAISLRASLIGVRIDRTAAPRDVTRGTRSRTVRQLEPIPDRADTSLPQVQPPRIVPAAAIVAGMTVNKFPVGTCAAPALRIVTAARVTTAGRRSFFQLAWVPQAAGEYGRREAPFAHWDLDRLPDLSFEVYPNREENP